MSALSDLLTDLLDLEECSSVECQRDYRRETKLVYSVLKRLERSTKPQLGQIWTVARGGGW